MKPSLLVPAVLAVVTFGCSPLTAPHAPDRDSTAGLAQGVDGHVVWLGIEGGFWAIETADGRLLDPHESLPAAFRAQGLPVHVAAQALQGHACIHQAGIIVDVIEIRAR